MLKTAISVFQKCCSKLNSHWSAVCDSSAQTANYAQHHGKKKAKLKKFSAIDRLEVDNFCLNLRYCCYYYDTHLFTNQEENGTKKIWQKFVNLRLTLILKLCISVGHQLTSFSTCMPWQMLPALHQVMYTDWPSQSAAEALLVQMVQFRWKHSGSCFVARWKLGSLFQGSWSYCHFSHSKRYHFVLQICCNFPWGLVSYNFKTPLSIVTDFLSSKFWQWCALAQFRILIFQAHIQAH